MYFTFFYLVYCQPLSTAWNLLEMKDFACSICCPIYCLGHICHTVDIHCWVNEWSGILVEGNSLPGVISGSDCLWVLSISRILGFNKPYKVCPWPLTFGANRGWRGMTERTIGHVCKFLNRCRMHVASAEQGPKHGYCGVGAGRFQWGGGIWDMSYIGRHRFQVGISVFEQVT